MIPDRTYTFPPQEVFALLKTSREGLPPAEAQLRLQRFGPNVLFEERRFKTLKLLLAQFANFFIPLLLLASVLSFAFGSVVEGAVLLAITVLNVAVSFVQERKSERALEKLRKVYPAEVEVVRERTVREIAPEELVIGDVVVLREGNAVPADLRLFEVADLEIDEASLTGESSPSLKVIRGLSEGIPLADRENMAYTGTLVARGSGKGVVTKTGKETEFGRIAAFVQEEEERSLLLERINRLSVWMVGFAAFLALLILVLELFRDNGLVYSISFAIAAFVSAVPESLPTTTTLALSLTALRLSRQKALVRRLPTVEALSGINLFAFDKTGTLTRNELSVARIVFSNRQLEVTGEGFFSVGEVLEDGGRISLQEDPDLRRFVEVGARASSATISLLDGGEGRQWAVYGDPTEGAFLVLAKKLGLSAEDGRFVADLAFTGERRIGSRVFEKGGVSRVYSLGAPETILARSSRYWEGEKEVALSPQVREAFAGQTHKLASQGYRVLALATKELGKSAYGRDEAESGLTLVGFAGLLDKPKKNVAETFAALQEAGIRPVIVTGDHPQTALAVGRSLGLGIKEDALLTGEDLDRLSDGKLLKLIPRVSVFARITPSQKYRLVVLFKRLGGIVAVSGDGINDAPALKKADVGVVMGEKGTDVSKEAADLVIMDDKIETVLPAIAEARTLYDNIRKFFVFLLGGNFEELLIIAAALALSLPQPFTTLQILWVNFITDSLPAFALAYDPSPKDVLTSPPRDLSPRMIRPVLAYALFLGAVSLVGELLLFLFYLPNAALARTMVFTGAVLFELFIVFSIRTPRPLWENLFSNRYLVLAFGASLLLQLAVIYLAPLQGVMDTVALGIGDWAVIVAFITFSLVLAELAKWFVRRRARVAAGDSHLP